MSGRYRWVKGTNDFVEIEAGYVARPRSGPILLGDYSTYDCPVTGRPVDGRAAHSENLKRQNCRLLEKGETRESPKRIEESFNAGLDRILGKAEQTMAGVGE
jgi:hypothetical protein